LDETYSHFGLTFDPSRTDLLLTEPLFNPESLRKNMYEVIFEEYGFKSLFTPSSQMLSLYDYQTNNPITDNPCAIVVDSGYSFTHIVPFFDSTKMTYTIKRINVGGKLLTNYLKEIISYRQWNMMHETYLMNHVKERLCYVPMDYLADLKTCNSRANSIAREYVLPDMVSNKLGYVKGIDTVPPLPPLYTGSRSEEQILKMNNERLIPEVLFRPADIGINQAGIAEVIVQAVNETPKDLHGLMYSNIVLMGGCTLFPGFVPRLEAELRSLVPIEFDINIHFPKDPVLSAWRGGNKFTQRSDYNDFIVTRTQFLEQGPSGFLLCKRRFDSL